MAHTRRNYDTQPYWEGCDQRELRIARCADCHTWIHFPRGVCPNCWSDDVRHEAVAGDGQVVTFSRPRVPDGAPPMVTALVALDAADGVRVLGRLEGAEPDAIRVGMPVSLDWHEEDGQLVPQFVPSGGAPA